MNPETPQPGNDGFDDVINGGFHTPGPYGLNPHIPAHSIPVKPGLTRRGRAALAIGVTVLAGGGLLGYQHYATAQAANELKAKELQIEQDKIALEQQKALDNASRDAEETRQAADKERRALVDGCVNDNKALVGKQLGVTYRSVLEDCQAQYPDSGTTGADIQEAASASDSADGGSASTGLLIGGGVVLGGLLFAAKRATRPQNPQPVQVYTHYPTN